jgi:hypothetical protein
MRPISRLAKIGNFSYFLRAARRMLMGLPYDAERWLRAKIHWLRPVFLVEIRDNWRIFDSLASWSQNLKMLQNGHED